MAPSVSSSPELGTVVATATVQAQPSSMIFDPADGYTYVANYGTTTVSVIHEGFVLANLTVGTSPIAGAYDATNQTIYIANSGSGNVSVLQGTNVVGTVTTGGTPTFATWDPADNEVYVGNSGGLGSVFAINGTRVETSVPAAATPIAGLFDAANGEVYVANNGGNSVTVICGATSCNAGLSLKNTVVTTITGFGGGGRPSALALDGLSGYLFVTDAKNNQVDSINTLGNVFGNRFGVGNAPSSIVYDPASGYLYDAAPASNQVNYFAGNSLNPPVSNVGVGTAPNVVLFDPGNGNIYATDSTGGQVSIVGMRLLGTLIVQTGPNSLSYDPNDGDLYVTNEGSSTVSIISTMMVLSPVSATPPGSPPMSGTVGTPVTFWANLTGVGNGTDSVSISASPSGLGCAASATLTLYAAVGVVELACTPSAPGTYTLWVNASDGAGSTVAETASFDVLSVPVVSAPTPSVPSVDLGQSVLFSTTASGGTGTYPTYTWSASSVFMGCTFANGPSISCAPFRVSAGYTVSVSVTDSGGRTSATAISSAFTVYADPALSTPSVQVNGTVASQADQGETLLFTASLTSSGSGGISSYGWTALPPGCAGTGNTVTCTASAAAIGTYSVSVSVRDSNGVSATSASASLSIFADPTLTGYALHPSADVGQGGYFVALPAGGSGTYTNYTWSGLPGPECFRTLYSSTAHCVFSVSDLGTLTVSLRVTDSTGWVVYAGPSNFAFTVYADPSVSTPAITVNGTAGNTADAGQTVGFATTLVNPGSGGFSQYTWTGLPTGCAGTTASLTCKPTSTGTYLVRVNVTDSNGVTATSTQVSLTIFPSLVVPGPGLSVNPVRVGQSVDLSVTPFGGATPYATYLWSGLPSSCTGVTTATPVCTAAPSDVGSHAVSVQVTDALGWKGGSLGSTLLIVVTGSSSPTVSTPIANRSSADIGQSVSFSAQASGGSGGYVYAWSGLPASGCTGTTSATVSCALTAAGKLSLSVVVADSSGASSPASGTLSFTVYALPSLAVPTASLASGGLDAGQGVDFTTTITSTGSGGAVVVWTSSSNLLSCSSNPSTPTLLTCLATSSGNYTVTVEVTDSNGGRASALSASEEVLSDPTAPAPGANPSTVDVGASSTLATAPYGGAGGFSVQWVGLPAGCSGTTASISCAPSTAGTYPIWVQVTDANGLQVTSLPGALTVHATLGVSASASPTQSTAGEPVAFAATLSGGTAPWSIAWNFGDGGRGTGAGASHTYASPGTYTARVWLNDSTGASVSATVTVTAVAASTTSTPTTGGSGLSSNIPLWWLVLVLVVMLVALAVALLASRRRGSGAAGAAAAGEVGAEAEPSAEGGEKAVDESSETEAPAETSSETEAEPSTVATEEGAAEYSEQNEPTETTPASDLREGRAVEVDESNDGQASEGQGAGSDEVTVDEPPEEGP